MHKAQRLINHVALVLDGSGSMSSHKDKVVKVADDQIIHLMKMSEQLQQETRVSVYWFDDVVECLIFDMDVMRLPSIQDLYYTRGMTAMWDAFAKSQEDLKTTSQLYGDHAFLTFVLTDGGDNASRRFKPFAVIEFIKNAPENWTVGFMVPEGYEAGLRRLGLPDGSIISWDTSSSKGLDKVATATTQAVTSYMTSRSTGSRGTRSVFAVANTDAAHVNASTVTSKLTPIPRDEYSLHDVADRIYTQDFVQNKLGRFYRNGDCYYQFMKPETIQGGKELIIVEKSTGNAYRGPDARGLIGLQWGVDAKVKPADNPAFDIYVQSTAPNRNLIPGTKMLLLGKAPKNPKPVATPAQAQSATAASMGASMGASTMGSPRRPDKPKAATSGAQKYLRSTKTPDSVELVRNLVKIGGFWAKCGRKPIAIHLGLSERKVMEAFKEPTVAALRTR